MSSLETLLSADYRGGEFDLVQEILNIVLKILLNQNIIIEKRNLRYRKETKNI